MRERCRSRPGSLRRIAPVLFTVPHDLRARFLGHCQRFAGDHALIDVRRAAYDQAVNGYIDLGTDEHDVARNDLVDRQLLSAAVTHDGGGAGLQAE